MSTHHIRSKWAAVGAAVAVSLGAGGIGITQATTSTGEKPIYLPIEPCRLTDTRAAFQVGPRSAPLGPNETYTLSGQGAVGNCDLPAGTTAIAVNVTAIDATAPTFVSLFPAGAALPVASHLNPLPGQGPVPNAVNVDLSADGEFSIYNLQGNVNIFIDVVGVYDDHTHDDRYYTRDQVDDRYYTRDQMDAIVAPLQAKLATLENPVTVLGSTVGNSTLTTGAKVHATATLVPEFDGTVLATSTAYVFQNTAAQVIARCYLTQSTGVEAGFQQYANINQAIEFGSEVIAGTRLFPAEAGVPMTINLVCRATDPHTDGRVDEISLTAVLLPT